MPTGTVSSITPTERKEIRNIIDAEFELLSNELHSRARTMQDEAEARVREQFAADVRRAEEASQQLKEMIQEFENKAIALEREFSDRGLQPSRTFTNRYGVPSSFQISIAGEWKPKQLEKAVQEARQEIQRDLNRASTELTRQKLDIKKALSLTAIQTADAQNFLNSIPKAEELLPPREMPELEATVEEAPAPRSRSRRATPKKD